MIIKIMKRIVLGGALICALLYVGLHLEFDDPYKVSSVINAAHMSQDEINQDPIKANSLTYEAAQELYQTLEKSIKVLKKNKIDYWITCATLLGAVRHESVICLDDDIDLAIWGKDSDRLLALKKEFYQAGLGIYKDRTSIKIYRIGGPHVRPKRKTFQILPGVWFVRHKQERFPTLDIHPMQQEGEHIVCAFPRAREVFKNEYFLKDELYPLKSYHFGALEVMGPSHPFKFLSRKYGETWNDLVYFASRHTPGTGQTFQCPLSDELRKLFYRFGMERGEDKKE